MRGWITVTTSCQAAASRSSSSRALRSASYTVFTRGNRRGDRSRGRSIARLIAATIASCKHAITFGRYCRDRVISLLHGPIVTGGDCGLERIRFKRCLLVYKAMNSMHRRSLTYSKSTRVPVAIAAVLADLRPRNDL